MNNSIAIIMVVNSIASIIIMINIIMINILTFNTLYNIIIVIIFV